MISSNDIRNLFCIAELVRPGDDFEGARGYLDVPRSGHDANIINFFAKDKSPCRSHAPAECNYRFDEDACALACFLGTFWHDLKHHLSVYWFYVHGYR